SARFNDGAYAWNPSVSTQQALIRIRSQSRPGITDVSHSTFVIGSATQKFYVNDDSTAGDQYTTAVGNNANSGTTPADPMASLSALLAAYELGFGDTVYVDSGVYNLPTNIRITNADSGVAIVGPIGSPSLG